jgi:hypothetical protein
LTFVSHNPTKVKGGDGGDESAPKYLVVAADMAGMSPASSKHLRAIIQTQTEIAASDLRLEATKCPPG